MANAQRNRRPVLITANRLVHEILSAEDDTDYGVTVCLLVWTQEAGHRRVDHPSVVVTRPRPLTCLACLAMGARC